MSLWHQTKPGRALRFPGGACPRCQSDLLLQGDVMVLEQHPGVGCKVYLSGTVRCVGCGTTATLPDTGLVLPELPLSIDLGPGELASQMRSTAPLGEQLHENVAAVVDSAMDDEQIEPDVAAVIAGYYADDQVWEPGSTGTTQATPMLASDYTGAMYLSTDRAASPATSTTANSTSGGVVTLAPGASFLSHDPWTPLALEQGPFIPKHDVPGQPDQGGFAWELEWNTQKAYKRGAIVIYHGVPCIATKNIPPKWAFRFSDGWIALGSSPDAYKWTILASPWKPTTLYKAGQMVTYGGVIYWATKLIPGTSVFRPEDGWKVIEDPSAIKPKPPAHGPYLGHWAPGCDYTAGDAVQHEGQYYRASRNIPADLSFLLDSGWELVDTQGSQSELASAVTTAEQAFKKLEQAFAAGAKEFGEALQALPPASASYEMVSPLATLCAANGWSYQGSLQVHKTYYPNDVVIVDGEYYRCIEEASGLTYPPMSMKWQKLMQANAQQSVTPASETEGSVLPELSFEEKPLPALEWSYEYKPGLSVTTTNTKLLALCAASGFVYRGSWEVGHSYNAGDVITIGATAWLCNHTSMCNCSPVAANGHWTRLLN